MNPILDDLFPRCVEFVLREEGGYSNDPQDKGGETNYGICKRDHPDLDIKNLTKEQAIEIYRAEYWEPSGAPAHEWPLCLAVFDAAVLQGPRRAKAWADDGPDYAEYLFRRLKALSAIKGTPWLRGWCLRLLRVWEAGKAPLKS